MQISVIPEKHAPERVLESYTFSFEYRGTEDERVLDGMTLAGADGRPMTVKNARQGLSMIIRYLIQLAQTLPDLPGTRHERKRAASDRSRKAETRYLTTHLFYTADCPEDYLPAGFRTNEADTMLFPESKLWNVKQADLGRMDSGFHR